MAESNTFVNALIGAVVSVVLAFIPLSPVLGGAVAGYLQGGDEREGARIGGLSGAIAAIPLVLLAALVLAVVSFVTIAPDGVGGGALILGAFFVLGLLFLVLYTVGLGALGGILGVYVAERSEESRGERVEYDDETAEASTDNVADDRP